MKSKRIAAELEIGRASVRAAMRRENLRAIAPRSFKPQTTDSNHDSRISPNLLKEAVNAPSGAGEVIVGDITYIRLRDGSFCYLAIFQDKFTRRIVGWVLSVRMTVQLVIDAFQMARRRALIRRGAINHTDCGSLVARQSNFGVCFTFAASGNRCRRKATVTTMLKPRASFPGSKPS